MGVALGYGFTLAVTDAGTVFSFRYCRCGALGHGSLEAEMLPRRIKALAQMRRRFVAVIAGYRHTLALTVEGELYGWGRGGVNDHGRNELDADANGHRRNELTPRQVASLDGHRVKHVDAGALSSCSVTEKGELYTWGGGYLASWAMGMRRTRTRRSGWRG